MPTSHGLSKTPEYATWCRMIDRCENEKNPRFDGYGGRGIKICDEWRNSFPVFFSYVGSRPSPNHSIDRINNDGNYEPGNVRWATLKEQMNNTRVTTQTFCKRGHPYSGNNLYLRPNGRRACRQCIYIAIKKYRESKFRSVAP